MKRLAVVVMILADLALAYYGSWLRQFFSLGAAIATMGVYVLLFRGDLLK